VRHYGGCEIRDRPADVNRAHKHADAAALTRPGE
jgi:hypothetical protein